MPPPPLDLDTASLDDVKRLVQSLAEEVGRLRAENSGLREEIARLKGLPAKPKLKPSGMEKKTERAEVKRRRKQKRRGAKALAETVTETRVVAAAVPAGARFKGYQDFLWRIWRSAGGWCGCGASAGFCPMARWWWRRCRRGYRAISVPGCGASFGRNTIRVRPPSSA